MPRVSNLSKNCHYFYLINLYDTYEDQAYVCLIFFFLRKLYVWTESLKNLKIYKTVCRWYDQMHSHLSIKSKILRGLVNWKKKRKRKRKKSSVLCFHFFQQDKLQKNLFGLRICTQFSYSVFLKLDFNTKNENTFSTSSFS